VTPSDKGDSKANILISGSYRACLADFGLSTAKESISYAAATARVVGTLRWQAPELLDPDNDADDNTLASDVYAFACVCYEVVFGSCRCWDWVSLP
jgi:serine/threonine protein kinase